MRAWPAVVVAAIAVGVMVPAPAGGGTVRSVACAATPHALRPPTSDLAKLSSSWWVKNYVWMGVAGAFHGEGFEAVPKGQKVGWYRRRPGHLRLYARRLGGPPAGFASTVPSGYGLTGFQASGLTFAAPGCWALTAVVGTQRSRFVVEVAPAPAG